MFFISILMARGEDNTGNTMGMHGLKLAKARLAQRVYY
jgi:hypothetical protein